jgi:hypothetical protein
MNSIFFWDNELNQNRLKDLKYKMFFRIIVLTDPINYVN